MPGKVDQAFILHQLDFFPWKNTPALALLIGTFLISCTLCSCQKSKNDGPADLFDGKKLAGVWTPVPMA